MHCNIYKESIHILGLYLIGLCLQNRLTDPHISHSSLNTSWIPASLKIVSFSAVQN
jgi:hypothetical protein